MTPMVLSCGWLLELVIPLSSTALAIWPPLSAKEQVLGVSTVVAGVEEAKTKNLLICIVHANHGLKK